jgi:CRISPR-associated protein Cas1
MGIEGAISAEYFKAFRKILKTELEFEKRTRRPAKDPVNALLNLGYTFLTNEISSLLESMSFETCLGFLHGVQYGRKSLALDMVEEFRQPVIDKFILNILNKKVFKKVDFEETDKGFILSEDAFGKFCIEYQRYITKRDKDGMNFEEVFKNQINLLKESIMKNKVYKPYRMEI